MRRALLLLCGLLSCGGRSELGVPVTRGDAQRSDAGCALGPAMPTAVATFEMQGYLAPNAIAVVAGVIYVGAGTQAGGQILRVPADGSAPVAIASDYGLGPIAHDERNLYYAPTLPGPGGPTQSSVVAYDAIASTTTTLPIPPKSAPVIPARILVTIAADGRLVWAAAGRTGGGMGITVIGTWDGQSATTVGTLQDDVVQLVASSSDAYVIGKGGSLVRVPLSGGAQASVATLSGGLWQLVGATGAGLVYSPDDDQVLLDGNAGTTTLDTGAQLTHCGGCANTALVDGDWAYYAAYPQYVNYELRRVNLATRAIETVYGDPMRLTAAVTTDACDIYWVVSVGLTSPLSAQVYKRRL